MSDKLVLIITPFFWPKLPPLGLAYLSSFLASKGVSHSVLDFNIALYNQAADSLKKEWQVLNRQREKLYFKKVFGQIKAQIDIILTSKVQYIGFSVFKNNLLFSLDLAHYIKTHNPDKRIIFGGPEVFYLKVNNFKTIPAKYSESVDHYVVGEGESSLYALLEGKIKEKIIIGEEVADLNILPYPDFLKFDIEQYERKKAVSVFSSRGCIYKCEFCAECQLFKKYRTKTPEFLLEEISYLSSCGVKWVTFNDSLINGNLKNLEQFCDLLIEQNLKIKWDAQFAIREGVTRQLLEKMKISGCFNLFIGLESGSASVLKRMKKGFKLGDAERIFEICQDIGLHFETSLIVGFPLETELEFQETLDFLRKNKKNIFKIAQVNPFVLLEGSGVFKELLGKEILPSLAQKQERVARLVAFLIQEKIKFTNAFINNLGYK